MPRLNWQRLDLRPRAYAYSSEGFLRNVAIYLVIGRTYRQGKKVYQKQLCRLGRLDQLQEKGEIDRLIKSLAQFSRRRWVIADEIVDSKSPE